MPKVPWKHYCMMYPSIECCYWNEGFIVLCLFVAKSFSPFIKIPLYSSIMWGGWNFLLSLKENEEMVNHKSMHVPFYTTSAKIHQSMCTPKHVHIHSCMLQLPMFACCARTPKSICELKYSMLNKLLCFENMRTMYIVSIPIGYIHDHHQQRE